MMDYSELNLKHLPIVRCLAVSADGKARIVLEDGSIVEAESPEDADSKLTEREGLADD